MIAVSTNKPIKKETYVYFDDNWNVVDRAHATRVEIRKGNRSTMGNLLKPGKHTPIAKSNIRY